jgi:hypothetical protein
MNARELIDEFKQVVHLFEWRLVPHSVILESGDRRTKPRWRLRGTCKNDPQGAVFEPIGAVCFVRTEIIYGEDNWLESALTIGLSPEDARDLTAAANDLAWRQVGDRREPEPYRQMLRQTMVAAMGLDAEVTPPPSEALTSQPVLPEA